MEQTVDILSDAQITGNLERQEEMDRTIHYLYRMHYDTLSRYVMHNSGSEQDAEDIFQEVMVAFISLVQAAKFRGDSSIKTFLYALNKNMWLNELKRRGRASKREAAYEIANEKESDAINKLVEDREAHRFMLQTVEELGENCKKILLLYYYEQQSMREIVASMHYENEQVVRNQKYKCLKKLEVKMTQQPALLNRLKSLLHE